MGFPQQKITARRTPEAGTDYVPVGTRLRLAREKRGEKLFDVAEFLCIKPEFLQALELGRYDLLPPHAYVMGFLRSYADYLGLDGHGLRELYRRELAEEPRTPQLYLPQPLIEGKTPHLLVILGSLILAVGIYMLWYFSVAGDRAVVAPPSLPGLEVSGIGLSAPGIASEDIAPAQVAPLALRALPKLPTVLRQPVKPEVAAPAPEPQPEPPVGQQYGVKGRLTRVIIKAKRKSWIMVTDAQNATIFSQTLQPGDSYLVPEGGDYHLTTGNAAGLVFSVDGRDITDVKKRFGEEIRDLKLDPAVLSSP